MCSLFTENAAIFWNSKEDRWVPGRQGQRTLQSHRAMLHATFHVMFHFLVSFLNSHCTVIQCMNYFFLFLVSVFPCPVSTHPSLHHCCHLRSSFPSFLIPDSDLQTTSASSPQLFSQKTTHLHPYTWNGKCCGCRCTDDSAGLALCVSSLVMVLWTGILKAFSQMTALQHHILSQTLAISKQILLPTLQTVHSLFLQPSSLMASPSEHELYTLDLVSTHHNIYKSIYFPILETQLGNTNAVFTAPLYLWLGQILPSA